MRVFIAALATESNSFAPFPTGLQAFEAYGLVRDTTSANQQPGAPAAAASPFAAQLATLRRLAESAGDEVIESLCAFAQPAGPTVGAVYEDLRDRILADLGTAMQAGPVDLVLLALHGAMLAEGHDDCEGELVGRVRAMLPRAVIGVELDLHCHLRHSLLRDADLVILYKAYPHTDMCERAQELFHLCRRAGLGEIRPVAALVDTQMVGLYPTFDEPTKGIVAALRAAEAEAGVLSASIAHGFPWGDVPDVGTRVLVIADADAAVAAQQATALAQRLYGARQALRPAYPGIEEALDRAAAAAGRVVLADTADNPGGGAAGDSTFFLRALLVRASAHDARDTAIGCIWDPVAAGLCADAGIGARLALRLGGKCGPASGEPVDLTVQVCGIQHDHSQASFGARRALGLSVWLRVLRGTGSLHIVVVSTRTQVFDPDAFSGLGLDLAPLRLIVVKSSSHFEAGFRPIADHLWRVATPGTLQLDFEHLPYTRRDGHYFPRVDDPWAGCGPPAAVIFDRAQCGEGASA